MREYGLPQCEGNHSNDQPQHTLNIDTKFFPLPLDLSQYAVNRVSASNTPSPAKKRRIESSTTPSTSLSPGTHSETDALSRARLQSSMRVISIWNSLEDKYAKGLADDDIVNLGTGKIIQDTGALRSVPDGKWTIGCFAGAEHEEQSPDSQSPSGNDQSDEDDDLEDDEADFEGWAQIEEQFIVPPSLPRVAPPKSYVSFSSLARDEEEDLDQFLRAEAQRRTCEGDVDAALEALTGSEDECDASDDDESPGEASDVSVKEEYETSADELNLVDPVSRDRSVNYDRSMTVSRGSPSPGPEPEGVVINDDRDPLDGFAAVQEQYLTPVKARTRTTPFVHLPTPPSSLIQAPNSR